MSKTRPWNASIPLLLGVTYLIGVALFVGLTMMVTTRRVSSEFHAALIKDAEQIAARFAADSTLALALGSRERASVAIDSSLALGSVKYAAIYELDGSTFLSRGILAAPAPIPKPPNPERVVVALETPEMIFIDAPITIGNTGSAPPRSERLGWIRLGVSKAGYQGVQGALQSDLWWTGLLFGTLCLAVLLLLTKLITDPLRRLTAVINTADESRAFTDAPERGTVEVRQIARAYNRLMSDLQSERESLERRVRDRTASLAKAKEETERVVDENRKLIQEMHRLLEQERRYIAVEIHDQLNALMVAMRLGLQRVQKRLDKPDLSEEDIAATRKHIDEVLAMVEQSYRVARQIIHRLRPEVLDALGLRGAIEDMVAGYNRMHPSTQFEFNSRGEFGALGDEVNIALFRIVQEALSNAVKHAHATVVKVSLQGPEMGVAGPISVSIEDNGGGIDKRRATGGIGLMSMRERARGIGGEFTVEASPGGGTTVRAVIPAPTQGVGGQGSG